MPKYISDSKMKPALKEKWVKALRSGEYKKTKLQLEQLDKNGKYMGNCCLGVLCRITKTKSVTKMATYSSIDGVFFDDQEGELTPKLLKKFGIGNEDMHELINRNDGGNRYGLSGQSFKQIANFIEKNIA